MMFLVGEVVGAVVEALVVTNDVAIYEEDVQALSPNLLSFSEDV